jgi:ketosteroid isomerase-like protein
MKCIVYFALFALLFSCGQNSKSSTAAVSKPATEVASNDTTTTKAPEENVFDYPVLNKNWQIGNHNNTRLVLQVYKAWDKKAFDDMKALLADTVIMDLPNGVRRSASNAETVNRLLKQRKTLSNASNEILVAYPLVNKDNNEEWVSVLTYNKWMYKDKTRDSMLYQDLWKIKNGKVSYLLSLEQMPSRMGAKTLEKLTQSN